jgi:hypothetical protein
MTYPKQILKILDLSYKYKLGHIPSSLSVLPILMEMKEWSFSFNFFCGKAYGLQAYLAAWEIERIPNTFAFTKEYHGVYGNINYIYTDLTLGNALGNAIGYSIANPNTVNVVLMSDAAYFMGETQEGLEIIEKFKLPIIVVVDSNGCQLFGSEKIRSSHGFFISNPVAINRLPRIMIFPTTKGNGVLEMELSPKDWHYKILTEKEYLRLRESIEEEVCDENDT